MSEIGIVIVTYNSQSEIGPCLDAALATRADVVVVDNGSRDGTLAEVAQRGVRVVANRDNRGFAAAVNQGFRVLNSPYVLLLNPDAVILGGLDAMRQACDLEGAAGAGGCLIGADNKPQTGFMVRALPTPAALILEVLVLNRIWPNNPVNRRYRAMAVDYSLRTAVEQPAGAFLMLRRAVWQELGGFDEGYYPVWFEDVDFCRRAAEHNYVLFYTPEAVARHTGGHSISSIGVQARCFYWYRSLLRYSARHYGPFAFRMVCLSVLAGSILRGAAGMLLQRSRRPLATYGNVVRLAGYCLLFGWKDAAVMSGSRF
ncbi:MAG: glycosyltransferase family 2 protein [Bryobacteraceae bacterium]|jgi:GT2 family glycosyltransferase